MCGSEATAWRSQEITGTLPSTVRLDLTGEPATAIYTRDPRVGAFMKEKFFGPGALLSWNKLTEFATDEELNAKAFAAEFGE
jgi:hypothetical protein